LQSKLKYDNLVAMNTVMTPVNVESRKGLVFKAGDTVRVKSKIIEKGKTRLQAFEGLVLARKHGTSASATFTVRKVSNGVGVERIFPLYSPNIDSIELLKQGKTRRAKLYFIRDKAVKEVARRLRSVVVQLQKAEKNIEQNIEANVDEAIADIEEVKEEIAKEVEQEVEQAVESVENSADEAVAETTETVEGAIEPSEENK
jgi:large subunit ribosomal protein L19